jgi:hypothetical protein
MQPKVSSPARHFWTVGSRQCVLYVTGGAYEVRLLDEASVVSVAVCRDGTDAYNTARKWRARPPSGVARTPCPRCTAAQALLGSRTQGFAYLRCNGCREVWRIPERRSSERLAAEGPTGRRLAI